MIDVIDVKRSVLEDNDKDATLLRCELKNEETFYINLMSSPGSGKTTTLIKVLRKLNAYRTAVLEADIDSDVDALKIANETQAEAIQLHTGGMCHLDASMSRDGLKHLKTKPDIVFLENVGNLVCPAEFDTGAHLKIMILAVPEGDDKPLKYPLMFSVCDLIIINKIDTISYFDFSLAQVEKNIRLVNQKAPIITISAKTGEGIDQISSFIITKYKEWKEK